MSKVVIDREEQDLLQNINNLIEDKVHKQIEMQIKSCNSNINEEQIRKKCSNEVFHQLEEGTSEFFDTTSAFFDLFRIENPHLYKKIEEQAAINQEDFPQIKNFHDIVKFGKKKNIDSELLDEIYSIGVKYYSSNKFDKSLLCFNWLCVVDSKNPLVWLNRGIVEQNLHNYDQALASYYHLISIEPNFIHGYVQLMNCLILKGDSENAKHFFQEFTHNIDPKIYELDNDIKENIINIGNLLNIRK